MPTPRLDPLNRRAWFLMHNRGGHDTPGGNIGITAGKRGKYFGLARRGRSPVVRRIVELALVSSRKRLFFPVIGQFERSAHRLPACLGTLPALVGPGLD